MECCQLCHGNKPDHLAWQMEHCRLCHGNEPDHLAWQMEHRQLCHGNEPDHLVWQMEHRRLCYGNKPDHLAWQTEQCWLCHGNKPNHLAWQTEHKKKNLTGHKPCTEQRASHKTVLKFLLEQWQKMSFRHCSTHSCDTVLFKEILSNNASWPKNVFKKMGHSFHLQVLCDRSVSIYTCERCTLCLFCSWGRSNVGSVFTSEEQNDIMYTLPPVVALFVMPQTGLPNTKTWCFCRCCHTTDTDSWLRNEVSGHHLAPSSSSHWSWVRLRSHRHYQHCHHHHHHHHHHPGAELGSDHTDTTSIIIILIIIITLELS